MERGVFIGGILITASLMIAVLLNSKSRHEHEPTAPIPSPTTEMPAEAIVPATAMATDASLRLSSQIASAAAPLSETAEPVQPQAL